MNRTVHNPLFTKQLPKIESCEGCGLCCSEPHIVMALGSKERDHLAQAGTLLERAVPVSITKKIGELVHSKPRYERIGACALLDEHGKCQHYDNRPDCCVDFKRGGYQCMNLRRKAGIITDEDFDI